MPWLIEPLCKTHPLETFTCGESPLDDYLKKNAWQSSETGLGRTFIAREPEKPEVCGYFTLAAGSVKFDTFPDYAKQRLPRYPIPTAHLAKLAVHVAHQGKGLGIALLINALGRVVKASEHVGVYAIDVIALNERARSFYVKYDFVPLTDNAMHLYMSIRKAAAVAAMV